MLGFFGPVQSNLSSEQGECAALRRLGEEKDARIAELLAATDALNDQMDKANGLVQVGGFMFAEHGALPT